MMLFDLPDLTGPGPTIDDETLAATLRELAAREREARVDFIVHLAEFDRRRLYLPAGFPSLFAWLVDHLRFSKASAYRRVTAARLYQRMPAVAAYLREGRLSLVKLCLLKDLLEPATHLALLEQAASMGEKEVEELAAVLGPSRSAPRDSIRPLCVTSPALPAPSAAPAALDLFAHAEVGESRSEPASPDETGSGGFMAEPGRPRPAEVPVRHVIRMTVGAEFISLLDDVRAELSHSHPGASLETILAECMRVTLVARRKRSRGQVVRPRKSAGPLETGSRHVPAEVRREVWARDGGRCTFVSADGHRCDATHQLELHHEIPFARGGTATVGGLRVVCRQHNDLFARRDFGEDHMDQFTGTDARGAE